MRSQPHYDGKQSSSKQGKERRRLTMPVSKEYLEAVSKDPALRAEAEQASLEALGELL